MESLNGDLAALHEEISNLRARVAELEQWNDAAERAAEALQRSDESFRRVFDHSIDGIFIVDPVADRIIDLNRRACSMLGYTREELLGRPMSSLHPDEMPQLMAFAGDVMTEGTGWTRELTCLTRAGIRLPTEISASVLDAGSQRYLVCLVRDISERKRAEEELLRANARMQSDLDAAAEVQSALLPQENIDVPGVDIGWQVRPSERLGGDLLDVYRLDDDHIGMYIVDVSGHGVSAAMLSIALHRTLSPASGWSPLLGDVPAPRSTPGIVAPSEICRRLNVMFPRNPITKQYCTVIYGLLNTRTRRFRFASGGHTPPLLVTTDGRIQELSLTGYPIGLLPNAEYEEREVVVPPGGRIYLYSDGITDVFGPDGATFGESRLHADIAALRHVDIGTSVTRLIEGALDWNSGLVPLDDISLLAFEVGAD